jgi:hypothetical protein
MSYERVRIPNKKAALRQVASHVAGLVGASDLEEATGLSETADGLTAAEVKRLFWASEEIQRRLYAMGGKS